MIQLVFFGLIGYILLYILAKLNIFSGLTRIFPMINAFLVMILIIVVIIKSGFIRVIATVIGTIIALLSEYFKSIF
nr:hypothetical protein [Lysinibacillus timonensis]